MQLITINDAAALSGKSIQTIRRMIKQRKISVKRQKTPQGFNYLIIKESLDDFMSKSNQPITQSDVLTQETSREHRPINSNLEELFKTEIGRFNSTIQKMVEQSAKDKENFFGLIKTFQDRVVTLEDQIKLLETPKKKKWFRIF